MQLRIFFGCRKDSCKFNLGDFFLAEVIPLYSTRLAQWRLSDQLLESLHDPYTNYKTPNTVIDRQYKSLLSAVAQTARNLCELKGYRISIVQDYFDRQIKPQDYGETDFREEDKYSSTSMVLQQRRYAKQMQRSVVEMLLFRYLAQMALPPRCLFAGFDQDENGSAFKILTAMVNRMTDERPFNSSLFFMAAATETTNNK
jgi:hypothetical protein